MKQTYSSNIEERQSLVQHIFEIPFQLKLFQVMPLHLNCGTIENQICHISMYLEASIMQKFFIN